MRHYWLCKRTRVRWIEECSIIVSLVFNSNTYQKLTRLYDQSPRYVFSFLDSELKVGKLI